MANAARGHDYHLVDPSPWPLLGSIGALILMVGAVHFMHPESFLAFLPSFPGVGAAWLMLLGLLVVLYTMLVWWKDVIHESVVRGDHTPVVKLGLRYGMVLFIMSEVMFFVAWFWAYIHSAIHHSQFMGTQWPPVGIETFDPWHLPLLNTVILLTSGTTVTWAHHAVMHGDKKGLIQGLWLTVILGAFFSVVQAYEYSHAAFTFGGTNPNQIYGSTFYMATGFHGFHVLVGTIFLAVCLVRAYKDQLTPTRHFGFEAAAWYWHFVDVVWLILFAMIYVWGEVPRMAVLVPDHPIPGL
ncbi:cytochrome c oxidase subunit 3 [Zavarzinia sp. CC-PAN008]|uniref:cytochrome c oxidase subunit 3 n=1 Tax=Zavarzinia sp. CC-PAN008 TaxID=3243332 RepID=UPI003F746599